MREYNIEQNLGYSNTLEKVQSFRKFREIVNKEIRHRTESRILRWGRYTLSKVARNFHEQAHR